jgi:hypothetical protein
MIHLGGNRLESSLMYIFVLFAGTKSSFVRDVPKSCKFGESTVLRRNYFARQATTLLKIAKTTNDPRIVAAVVTKAIDLKSHLEDVEPPADPSPRPPDVILQPDL